MSAEIPEMTAEELAQARKCVDAWIRAEPELERIRRQEIRQTDTAKSMPAFDGLFESAVLHYPALPTSGLIEQQRLFGKLKK